MKVTVKLFALLGRHLPAGSAGNAATVPAEAGSSVADVLAGFGLTERECHLVLLNGNFVPPDARGATLVGDGDVVSVWPPIGGG
ncbi:MAG: sulfur carrier protein ThiS [Actinomycetota bacterium]